MKKIIQLISILAALSLVVFVGCEDRSDLTAPGPTDTGTASFASYVSIGNSLTAGFQSNALYEGSQVLSFSNLIAQQVDANFVQPIISEPGIGDGGKLEIESFIIVNGELNGVNIAGNPNLGAPTNLNYAAPYNNLGIPGAILYDLVDETDFAAKSEARDNPFFSIVLRNAAFGTSVVAQALAQQPTFVTLWIGNNDVLGYATSGGTRGTDPTGTMPTDAQTFAFLYNQVATALTDTTGTRKVVAANIPDVQNIPFFTTIGPLVGLAIQQAQQANPQVQGLVYFKNDNITYTVATPTDLFTNKVLVTLLGSDYAPLIGQPTDKFYTDNNVSVPPNVDPTKPFGLDPANPWPNALILDTDEIATVSASVESFNATIKSIADASGWGLVDINKIFDNIKANEQSSGATWIDGIPFTTEFISGNLFSLDGVHPTSRGYAIVANEFIKVINAKFNADISLINVSTIPGSLSLQKQSELLKNFQVRIKPEFLKNVGYF